MAYQTLVKKRKLMVRVNYSSVHLRYPFSIVSLNKNPSALFVFNLMTFKIKCYNTKGVTFKF